MGMRSVEVVFESCHYQSSIGYSRDQPNESFVFHPSDSVQVSPPKSRRSPHKHLGRSGFLTGKIREYRDQKGFSSCTLLQVKFFDDSRCAFVRDTDLIPFASSPVVGS